jgi:tetratricopeptide (TPR) repeat protein
MDTPSASGEKSLWSDIPALCVVALAFLLPVFFLPLAEVSAQFSKTLLAFIALAVLFSAITYRIVKDRSLALSVTPLLGGIVALPVAYLISAAFSSNPALSFWGYQVEPDTFAFSLLGAGLSVAAFFALQNSRRIFSALSALFAAGAVVLIFEVIQLAFGRAIPLPLFSSPLINLVGSWNSLGLFAGLLVSLALVALEALELPKKASLSVNAVLVLSLVLIILVNFNVVWTLAGTTAFGVLVYALTRSFAGGNGFKNSGAAASCAVLLLSIFFIFTGGNAVAPLQSFLGVETLEVRPSVQATMSVWTSIYAKNPFVGTGPNTFSEQWLLARPDSIVGTPFWDVAFPAGFGAVPSAAAAGGAVVALGWLLLIGSLAITAGKVFMQPKEERSEAFPLVALSGVGALYLLAAHITYVPETSMTLLMFLFFGMLLAALRGSHLSKEVRISFVENPKLGFAAVFAALALSIGSLLFLYGGGTLYASAWQHQAAINASVSGDIDGARAKTLSAIGLAEKDKYYRTLTAIELGRLNALVLSGESGESAQKQFQETLASAINASARAAALNPNEYPNWITRASVYASVLPLNIDGAYESALAALEEARKRNPGTPEVDFRIAEMEIARKDAKAARAAAEASLAKKEDYTPSILLIAQLSLSEGKLPEAIDAVNAAVVLEPQNAQLLYQLGLLNLQAKKYEAAKDALEKALALVPEYANASFFLADAELSLGNKDEALKILTSLVEKNADNPTLKSVIADIQNGKNPFLEPIAPDALETPTK